MSDLLRNRRSAEFAGDEQGAAGVEFALLLPLLCVLLFGFFEIGRAFWVFNMASSSVRDAARFAARLPMTCAGLTNAADIPRVQKLARTGRVDGADGLVVGWTLDSTVSVTTTCYDNTAGAYSGRYDGITQIPRVEVSAAVPFSPMFATMLPGLAFPTITVDNSQVWTE